MSERTFTAGTGIWGGALVAEFSSSTWKGVTKTEDRKHVDALLAAELLCPHLPGKWRVCTEEESRRGEREAYTGHVLPRIQIVRPLDGLLLYIVASTNYGREYAIEVSIPNYKDARGESIDNRYLKVEGAKDASARCNLEKRDPKAVAKDIARRVIADAEKLLPAIRKRQDDSATQQSARKALVASLAKLEGVKVREHYNSRGTTVVEVGGAVLTVNEFGSVYVDRMSLTASNVAAFCKAMAKLPQ